MSEKIEINLKNNSQVEFLNDSEINFLPFKFNSSIFTDGLKRYFFKTIHSSEYSTEVCEASFRGRPLQGKKYSFPNNYQGYLIKKSSLYKYKVIDKFNGLFYWKLDDYPQNTDCFLKSFKWSSISEAINCSEKIRDQEQFELDNFCKNGNK